MRISDWSSDVCSSDLGRLLGLQQDVARRELALRRVLLEELAVGGVQLRLGHPLVDGALQVGLADDEILDLRHPPLHLPVAGQRSEEHTSELPSPMRLSYAVFCLKKKHKTTQTIDSGVAL